MAAEFAGVLHITVVSIDEFSDTAGFMDRTDPYVSLTLGDETYKTTVKDNAGGKNVVFDEKLSFNKQLQENILKVKVYDKDTLSDDFLGERDVDLNLQDLDGESDDPVPFDIVHKGKVVGKVYLKFDACV
eukprot:CAMPEP_0179451886 /NCGR_PEP_ID=MMETSP0799-20121207/35916_1 /TAXON_ID=46947 /ORGANISM="Geminigera cryophila, Strain CCMP2564" /LENGTH=129 /DNA_ID=CAMNT_0021247545 /DNA_START=25 /DNA_END=414 /DNA_ORIENTATION=-